MSLIYTTSKPGDLAGIIQLQRKNLPVFLSDDEIASQGFVTVVHSLEDLQKMNDIEQHVICKDNDNVIAYLLAMTARSANDIPVLIPMFEMFEKIPYHGQPVSAYNYIVVGQVCVDKNYRGQGILDDCYATYRKYFKKKYDFAITEIDETNTRSIAAHRRIGFTELYRYSSPDKKKWSIVIWDWR